jgi:two-component system, LytTR family, sensor kinase
MNIDTNTEKSSFRKTFFSHLSVWLIYLVLQFFWRIDLYDLPYIVAGIVQVITWAIIFYTMRLYLYPKYLWKNHLKLALCLMFIYPIYQLISIGYMDYLMKFTTYPHIPTLRHIRSGFFWFFNMCFIAFGFTYYDRLGEEKKEKEIIKSKLQKAELENLKAQFNPHFLFNALWYVYTMVQDNNQPAAKVLEILSSMMRYSMQNRIEKPFAPLYEELEYMDGYIKLQKVRNPATQIDYQVEGEIEGVKIIPLVLIVFIENAFKHGVTQDPLTPIKIKLSVKENSLFFLVSNNISSLGKERSSGIGLENAKSRLKSHYGKNFTLKVEEKNNIYSSELTINLLNP